MEQTKNKRMIYIHPDNKQYYDSLKNKSELVNALIRQYRAEMKSEVPDDYIEKKLAEIDGRSTA